MASKNLILTCCLVAFFGLSLAEVMPKDLVSKMKAVEHEAKSLMHLEPKRGVDDLVSFMNTSKYFDLKKILFFRLTQV